jgi:multidrug resistance efflux pump
MRNANCWRWACANQSVRTPDLLVDIGGSGDDDAEMEAHADKLETAVESLQREIKELKDDVRSARTDIVGIRKADVRAVRTDIAGIRTTDFRILFGAIVAVALGLVGLAGLMAKGFHWL